MVSAVAGDSGSGLWLRLTITAPRYWERELKPGTQDFPAVLEGLVLLEDPGEKVGFP